MVQAHTQLMHEQELSKERMDAFRELAETNMKIGEAKNSLAKVKEAEEAYLKERDEKATERIQKIIEDSRDLLKEVKENYGEIHNLANTASSFAGFLLEMSDTFVGLLADFQEKDKLWNEKTKRQEEEFEQVRNEIRADKVKIKNDLEAITRKKQLLAEDRRKLDDERGTLERAINRLKEGRI